MDATVEKPIQFEAHEEFDKAKRNVLFWSSALLALLFVPITGPIELFSLRGFAVPPNFATASIALITLYHAVGFFIETKRVYRKHEEYRGLKSSAEARLNKLSIELENSVGTVFTRSEQFSSAVVETTDYIQKTSNNLSNAESQIQNLRMQIAEDIPNGIDDDPATIPRGRWEEQRRSLAKATESIISTIETSQILEASHTLHRLKTSIYDGNAALGSLDGAALEAVESVKQALKKLDRFDRLSFAGFDVAITYLVVAIGLAAFCYSITDLPDQRGLTTAIFGKADAAKPVGANSTSTSTPPAN